MAVRKRGGRWYYDFMIKLLRYRGVIPEARTKWEAEQAETKIRLAVYEGRYGRDEGKASFSSFVEEIYLPWAKLNKRSWNDDRLIARVLCDHFAGRTFSQITPMLVEKFKKERLESETKRGAPRSPATVNRELAVLSRIFTLAADAGAAASNPCLRVRKLRQDNARTRYLTPEEEARLMAALESRPLLRSIVVLAVNTGMRRGELLSLRWEQVDISHGVIQVVNTKSGRGRVVPINSAAGRELEALRLVTGEYVFRSPRTGGRLTSIKTAW
jgi:integrase